MAASTPAPGFHDATVIDALEPSVWLELFDAFGAPPGFERERASTEYIVERLSVSGLTEPLQLALEWMYNLGSEDGIERLTSAARESNVDLSALRSAAPVEFVARVALLSTTNDAARRALDRAQTGALVAALPASRVHEFRGRTGKPLERLDERVADLRQRLTSWLDGLGLGDRVDVTLRSEGNVHRIVIVRGKRMQAPVTFTDSGRRPLPHRPVQCDLLVYDADDDLTAVHAPHNLVEGYRQLAGEVLWDDSEHLIACPCSLEPLKDGPAVLERHSITEIRSVSLTHAKFRPHEGGSCDYTDDDAFELMRRTMRVAPTEGDFVSARFQFAFYSGRGRPLTVEVRPDSVKVSRGPRQAIVLGALERMGIYRVQDGSTAPPSWDLAVGAHSRAEWSRHLSPAMVETFSNQGVLRGMRRASLPHAESPAAGNVLDVVVEEGDLPFFGESVHPDMPGRGLTHSDVEGLQLDAERLAALWATALETSSRPRELTIDGLYDIGPCTLGSKRLQLLLAVRAPVGDLARHASTWPTGSVVIAPRASVSAAWPVPSVEVESLAPDRLAVRRALVRTLRLESEVDARDRAGQRDTLIVDVPRHSVWLYGIEMRLSEGSFTFVRHVAAATQRGAPATKRELIVALAGPNAAENTARMAKKKAEETMKQQLEAAGIQPPAALFLPVKGGYRYSGSAFVGE